MKKCKRGHIYTVERDELGKNKGCPECRKATAAAFHQIRKQTDDFLINHKTTQAKWYKKHGSKDENRIAQRANRLKSRYWPHLTAWQALAEYEKILHSQNFTCRICEVHQDQYDTAFSVDHCHETGAVRGSLCMVCNRYIVGGIDIRAKAKKVVITKVTLIENIVRYFTDLDPKYIKELKKLNKKADK